jgi:hypothetical protein
LIEGKPGKESLATAMMRTCVLNGYRCTAGGGASWPPMTLGGTASRPSTALAAGSAASAIAA